MKLHNAIVHELVKQPDQTEHADKRMRQQGCFDSESNVLKDFAQVIHTGYLKKSKSLGRFDDDTATYPFQTYLLNYLEDSSYPSDGFIQFTQKAMDRLVEQAKTSIKAAGGFVLFMHYEVFENHYLMLQIISQKQVFNIEDLDIKDLDAVDLETPRYAVRIDINEWLLQKNGEVKDEDDSVYVSFLRGTASKVSDYFQNFIGVTDYAAPKQATAAMIDTCRQYLSESGEDNDARRGIEKNVLEFCEERKKTGQPVPLADIAGIINRDAPGELIDYINEHELEVPNYFEPDSGELRKLKRYEYRGENWNISFNHELFTNGIVVYNESNNTLTIKDVPADFAHKLDLI